MSTKTAWKCTCLQRLRDGYHSRDFGGARASAKSPCRACPAKAALLQAPAAADEGLAADALRRPLSAVASSEVAAARAPAGGRRVLGWRSLAPTGRPLGLGCGAGSAGAAGSASGSPEGGSGAAGSSAIVGSTCSIYRIMRAFFSPLHWLQV